MLLPILLFLLTGAACILFLHPPAWFPLSLSADAVQFDLQFERTLWTTGIIFIACQLLLAFVVLRFHRRKTAATQTGGHRGIEILWTAATAFVFLGLALAGSRTWADVHFAAPRTAEVVEVYAHQFAWSFRYPGPDGKFGRTDIRLINDAAGNPFGLDDRDPAARDDILSATLRVPVNREITLILHSRDVIHDFFVRELRLKQDVVPGMEIPYNFRATRTGRYEIACSELCGLGHSQMRGVLEVMGEREWERWAGRK